MNEAEIATLTTRPAASGPAQAQTGVLAGARYATTLQAGARLQEFEISAVIGQGGFGIVYLARDLSLQRRVAIKEYFPAHLAGRDTEGEVRALTPGQAEVLELGRRSFINEARMLARFKHAGLVEVFRFWEQNGTAYMAMPYYDGATLTQYLKRHPDVGTEAWLKKTLKPLVDALGHMHEEDCFHRDVAPDNILILKDGSAVLLDLGAARRVIANDAQAMTVMLKPGYAPIEQYSDDPRFRQGPWTDIYAMAAVFFFAVTGKAPPASASRVMRDSVSPLASVQPAGYSDSFLGAIDKGLSLQPEDRPRSIAEFRAMLYTAPPPETTQAGPMQRPAVKAETDAKKPGSRTAGEMGSEAAMPRARRFGGASLAAGIGALALAVAGTWLGLQSGGETVDAGTARTTPDPAVIAVAPAPDAPIPDAPVPDAPVAQAAAAAAATQGEIVAGENAAAPDAAAPDAAAPDATAPAPDSARKPAARPAAQQASRPSTTPAPASKSASQSDVETKPAATGSGTLSLAVKPWAEVRVNGVSKGISPPVKQLTLPAGRYTIELRNPAAAPVKQQVEVRANQRSVVAYQF